MVRISRESVVIAVVAIGAIAASILNVLPPSSPVKIRPIGSSLDNRLTVDWRRNRECWNLESALGSDHASLGNLVYGNVMRVAGKYPLPPGSQQGFERNMDGRSQTREHMIAADQVWSHLSLFSRESPESPEDLERIGNRIYEEACKY
tara:strand:- start:9518 stop:9961 length:444 start_codon:yes stop_codon:yes gene_type:complete